MFAPHTLENLKERLENLIAEFNDAKINDENKADISWEILEALTRFNDSPYISYCIIKDHVPTDTIVSAFKISASMLNKWLNPQDSTESVHDHSFCDRAGELLRSSCPEVEQTYEYKKLIEQADRLAGISGNTLLSGNQINAKTDNHLIHLSSFLESFAIATGKRIEASHFTAVAVNLAGSFKGCVLIKPGNAQSVLVIDNKCMSYNEHILQLMKALTPDK